MSASKQDPTCAVLLTAGLVNSTLLGEVARLAAPAHGRLHIHHGGVTQDAGVTNLDRLPLMTVAETSVSDISDSPSKQCMQGIRGRSERVERNWQLQATSVSTWHSHTYS